MIIVSVIIEFVTPPFGPHTYFGAVTRISSFATRALLTQPAEVMILWHCTVPPRQAHYLHEAFLHVKLHPLDQDYTCSAAINT